MRPSILLLSTLVLVLSFASCGFADPITVTLVDRTSQVSAFAGNNLFPDLNFARKAAVAGSGCVVFREWERCGIGTGYLNVDFTFQNVPPQNGGVSLTVNGMGGQYLGIMDFPGVFSRFSSASLLRSTFPLPPGPETMTIPVRPRSTP